MDYPVITIESVSVPWALLCIPFYVAAILFIIALICWRLDTYVAHEVLGTIGVIAAAIGAVCLFIGYLSTENTVEQHQRWALEEQMHYSRVEINTDQFTASDSDGQYVAGKLVEINTDTYAVVLLPE